MEGDGEGTMREAIVRMKELTSEVIKTALLMYHAKHINDCPQRSQNYWRMRGEYHPDFNMTAFGLTKEQADALPVAAEGESLWEKGIDPKTGDRWLKRVRRYGPDKPCTCGLDELIGKPDDRAQ